MAVIDSLKRWIGNEGERVAAVRGITMEDSAPVGFPPQLAPSNNWMPIFTGAGINVTPSNAREAPTVAACMRVIGGSLSSMEWGVFRTGNGYREPDSTSDTWWMLNVETSYDVSAMAFREAMQNDALLYGDGFAFIVRNASGRAVGMNKLRPDAMTLDRDPVTNRLRYVYDGGWPRGRVLDGFDIFHLKGPTQDGLKGESPIDLCREVIAVEIEAQQYLSNFFRNGARPSGIISSPFKLDEDKLKRLRETWQAAHGGTRNAAKVGILESGYTFTTTNVNPEEAQLVELRQFTRQQIAAAFGVPPHMVGDSAKQSYASAEQAAQEFVKHCLSPWAARWEAEARRKLVPMKARMETQILFDALLRGDMKSRFEALGIGVDKGFILRNEARGREGLAPVEGGNEVTVPSGSMLLSTLIKGGAQPQGGAPAPQGSAAPAVKDDDGSGAEVSTVDSKEAA